MRFLKRCYYRLIRFATVMAVTQPMFWDRTTGWPYKFVLDEYERLTDKIRGLK